MARVLLGASWERCWNFCWVMALFCFVAQRLCLFPLSSNEADEAEYSSHQAEHNTNQLHTRHRYSSSPQNCKIGVSGNRELTSVIGRPLQCPTTVKLQHHSASYQHHLFYNSPLYTQLKTMTTSDKPRFLLLGSLELFVPPPSPHQRHITNRAPPALTMHWLLSPKSAA